MWVYVVRYIYGQIHRSIYVYVHGFECVYIHGNSNSPTATSTPSSQILTSKHHSHSKCQCCISWLPVEAKLGMMRSMLNNNQFYFWNEPALNFLNLFFIEKVPWPNGISRKNMSSKLQSKHLRGQERTRSWRNDKMGYFKWLSLIYIHLFNKWML